MIANPPKVSPEEIRKILDMLKNDGVDVPAPERVEVAADEDFEGDPVFRMKVVFPASIPAESIPWERISPLMLRLRQLVFERGGYERPVLTEVRRLAEEPPEDS
jgi:hypothetical protein